MNGDLKQTFILQALTQFNEQAVSEIKAAMNRLGVNKTGEGMASIAFKALQEGGGAMSELSFLEYLRFVDMGVGRGHPLGGLMTMKVTLASQHHEGLKQVKDTTFKAKKIYAKPTYSRLGWLYGKLLYGYTEETVNMLKKQLQQDANIAP